MDLISTADADLATLRGDVIDIVLGTVFLTVGATACAIAAIRWRRGVGILVWWGIFSAMYGLQTLGQATTMLTVLPHSLVSVAPYVKTAVRYLLLVSALFAWRELSLGQTQASSSIWKSSSGRQLPCWVLARSSSVAQPTNGCSTTTCSQFSPC